MKVTDKLFKKQFRALYVDCMIRENFLHVQESHN